MQKVSLNFRGKYVQEYLKLNIAEMPTLFEVCVWTLPFPPEGVEVDTTGSPNVYFTTECSK